MPSQAHRRSSHDRLPPLREWNRELQHTIDSHPLLPREEESRGLGELKSALDNVCTLILSHPAVLKHLLTDRGSLLGESPENSSRWESLVDNYYRLRAKEMDSGYYRVFREQLARAIKPELDKAYESSARTAIYHYQRLGRRLYESFLSLDRAEGKETEQPQEKRKFRLAMLIATDVPLPFGGPQSETVRSWEDGNLLPLKDARELQKNISGEIEIWNEQKEKLINHNFRLVLDLVRPHAGRVGDKLPDLFNEAVLGLAEGIERMDPGREIKISTYARWWIKQKINRWLNANMPDVTIPASLMGVVREIRKAERSSESPYPADEEIAERTGLTVEQVREVRSFPRRIHPSPKKGGEEDKPVNVGDLRPDLETPERLTSEREQLDLFRRLRPLVLSPKEETVLCLCRGLPLSTPARQYLEENNIELPHRQQRAEGMTYKEVGELLNITRERVRQLIEPCERKLFPVIVIGGLPAIDREALAAAIYTSQEQRLLESFFLLQKRDEERLFSVARVSQETFFRPRKGSPPGEIWKYCQELCSGVLYERLLQKMFSGETDKEEVNAALRSIDADKQSSFTICHLPPDERSKAVAELFGDRPVGPQTSFMVGSRHYRLPHYISALNRKATEDVISALVPEEELRAKLTEGI